MGGVVAKDEIKKKFTFIAFQPDERKNLGPESA